VYNSCCIIIQRHNEITVFGKGVYEVFGRDLWRTLSYSTDLSLCRVAIPSGEYKLHGQRRLHSMSQIRKRIPVLEQCSEIHHSSRLFCTRTRKHLINMSTVRCHWEQVIAPGAARRYTPADGSSTRGGSTSVRGRVRRPHTAKLQAASVPIA